MYYLNIYSELYLQIEAVKVFIEIDKMGKSLQENLSPGSKKHSELRTK